MDPREFAIWLQGMLEYRDLATVPEAELRTMFTGVAEHLKLVFNKVTPEVKKPLELVPKVTPTPKVDSDALKKILDQERIKQPAPLYPPIIWPHYKPVDFDKPDYWLDKQAGLAIVC